MPLLLHMYMKPFIKKGLLKAGGKEIKNKKEILQLIEAVRKPFQVAVIHCKGHQRGTDPISKGNLLADQAAKEVAAQLSPTGGPESIFKVHLMPELPLSPRYSKEEDQWTLNERRIKEKEGSRKLPDQRLFVPSNIAIQLVKQHHETTHLRKTALESILSCYYFIPKLPTLCAQIRARCVTCAQNNTSQGPSPNPGVKTVGTLPFEDQKWTLLKSSPIGAVSIYLWWSAPAQTGLPHLH